MRGPERAEPVAPAEAGSASCFPGAEEAAEAAGAEVLRGVSGDRCCGDCAGCAAGPRLADQPAELVRLHVEAAQPGHCQWSLAASSGVDRSKEPTCAAAATAAECVHMASSQQAR